jgi:hypothetical protein
MLIVLTYAFSLSIRPSFKLNIYNRCLNIDLISPTYVTDGLECHRPPEYKVCAGSMMRSGFISEWDNRFYTVLIYRLQRRKPHASTEINEDALNATHLLTIWRAESDGLHAKLLVVEHVEGFIWNEKDLKELYEKNIESLELHPGPATEM